MAAHPAQSVRIWLTCVECKRQIEEAWDDRCSECFYIYTGGDQGEDDWWSKHTVVRDGAIHLDYK